MANVTVKQFAEVIGIPIDRLLFQLGESGLADKGVDDLISDEEKKRLLTHLRHRHGKEGVDGGSIPRKITLKRKSVSELTLSREKKGRGISPPRKTVTVEVRKKRAFTKRG
ncbi:MAG: translation initiation factor IF-2, partial [Gammaproteobacteria bacterium]|nr:translation initiation factor IF-2 [Gammaproteobacteria bacterium]